MTEQDRIQRLVRTFRVIYWTAVLLSVIVVGKIIYLQFLAKDIATPEDIYDSEYLIPMRGSILAHDGRPLAVSVSLYDLRWDSRIIDDNTFSSNIDTISKGLSEIFKDRTPAEYRKLLTDAKRKGKGFVKIGNRHATYMEREFIRRLPVFKLGQYGGGLIDTLVITKREHPYGRLAARTIGYYNQDGSGTGIELTYNYKLRGEGGSRKTVTIPGGTKIPVNGEPVVPPDDGSDIRTTIDVDIQEAAETELKEQLSMNDMLEGGTVIVMDVPTGAVRAIANLKKRNDGSFDEYYNYAFEHPSEPGSTFKLAALIALLEDGYVDLGDSIETGKGVWEYAGHRISDTHRGGYGTLSVKESFEKSSNIAFAKMITGFYSDDPASYISRLHSMKLFERLDLDIARESYARITTPEDPGWSGSSLATLGYGYAATLTPLHTLTFYNAVANGGKMVKPYFIEDFEKDGIIEEKFPPRIVTGSICSKGTLAKAREALRGVVTDGTATACNDPRYQIAGKTGTARIAWDNGGYKDKDGYHRHQASFAGYFPADNPKYSCIVVLYSGKTRQDFFGATWAVPVFKRVADRIYASHPEWNSPLSGTGAEDMPRIAAGRADQTNTALDYIGLWSGKTGLKGWVRFGAGGQEAADVSGIDIVHGKVPDVTGMGLKDALYLLENEGYKVSFSGAGRVVSQQPAPGTALGGKGKVFIKLE